MPMANIKSNDYEGAKRHEYLEGRSSIYQKNYITFCSF